MAATMLVMVILCPEAPYHREGDAFVGKMGRPATAVQYHLNRYLEATLFVTWICTFLSRVYDVYGEKDGDQKTGGSLGNAGMPDRVKPNRQRLRFSGSAGLATSGKIAPAETHFGTDHGEARLLGLVSILRKPAG
jgi:hypothetical protein